VDVRLFVIVLLFCVFFFGRFGSLVGGGGHSYVDSV